MERAIVAVVGLAVLTLGIAAFYPMKFRGHIPTTVEPAVARCDEDREDSDEGKAA